MKNRWVCPHHPTVILRLRVDRTRRGNPFICELCLLAEGWRLISATEAVRHTPTHELHVRREGGHYRVLARRIGDWPKPLADLGTAGSSKAARPLAMRRTR